MNLHSKYRNTSYGWIGIEPISRKLEDTIEDNSDKYATFDIKRLTRTNSFIIFDEVFYIAKKNCDGKAMKIYMVYRVSDKRLVCPSAKSKEDAIEMVRRKYIELDT